MYNEQKEEIMKSIDIIVKERLKSLSFDYTIIGKITKNLGKNTYAVIIAGENKETILKSRDNLKLSFGDIVYIRVVRGNESNKFIDCKKPL